MKTRPQPSSHPIAGYDPQRIELTKDETGGSESIDPQRLRSLARLVLRWLRTSSVEIEGQQGSREVKPREEG